MTFFIVIKDRSSLQYFITQGMGQSSMLLTFCTICNFRRRTSALGRVGGGKGGILGRLRTCLLEKWFPLRGERAHSLKLFCMYDKRFEIS